MISSFRDEGQNVLNTIRAKSTCQELKPFSNLATHTEFPSSNGEELLSFTSLPAVAELYQAFKRYESVLARFEQCMKCMEEAADEMPEQASSVLAFAASQLHFRNPQRALWQARVVEPSL